MANEIIGNCFICKKAITRHDIAHTEEGQEIPVARYYEQWPGDHVLCSEHPGVEVEYKQALEATNEYVRSLSRK